MRRPIVIATVLGILAAIATLVLILWSFTSTQTRVTCEVCLTFNGREVCREALGATEEEATRTAVDNACAQVASGMTASVACTTRTPLQRRECRTN
jgi:hypothetical protein